MTNGEPNQNAEQRAVTRYGWLTRYDGDPSGDREGEDTGSMKNFPKAFLPMSELDESRADA